jgi:hypothetical protein
MPTEAAAPSPYDIYLPEKEELNRLDSLLSDMVAKAQAELERLRPAGPADNPPSFAHPARNVA